MCTGSKLAMKILSSRTYFRHTTNQKGKNKLNTLHAVVVTHLLLHRRHRSPPIDLTTCDFSVVQMDPLSAFLLSIRSLIRSSHYIWWCGDREEHFIICSQEALALAFDA